MQRTITCVIPTLARSAQLRSALHGVLQQSHPPQRVIVVNDNPETAVEVQDLGLSRTDITVEVISTDAGRGASAARNTGAAEATTDLLAFLDDDDAWTPQYLQQAAAALDEAGTDMVVTWSWLVFDDGSRLPGQSIVAGLTAQEVIAINPGLTGSNVVITRQAFERIGGFDTDLAVSNDKDLLVRFLDAGFRYTVVTERSMLKFEHDGDRLTHPSLERVAALAAYQQKYEHRLTGRQRWQLRAKRARVLRRAGRSAVTRAAATAALAICVIAGGPVEGLPRAARRWLSRQSAVAVAGQDRRD